MGYSKFIKNIIFPIRSALRNNNTLKYLREMEITQWHPIEEVRELQWKRLKNLLDYAYANIPYYQGQLKKYNLKPSDIKTATDFLRVPCLTKNDVFSHKKELLSRSPKGTLFYGQTSGSTGLALELYYSSEHISRNTASQWRGRRWHGIDIGDKEVAFWGRPIDSNWEKVAIAIKERLQNIIRISGFDNSPEAMEKNLKKLIGFHPSFIYGYPSSIYEMAKFIQDKIGHLHELNLKLIECTAETLFNYQREVIKSVFGCPIANEYGCSEGGSFAFECPQGKMHISAENILVEFIKDGKPVMQGTEGEIFITTLHNYTMPLIRYRVGDWGIPFDGICTCGRGLPLMDVKSGKLTEIIVTSASQNYSSQVFDYINIAIMKKGLKGIKQFKVFQKTKDLFLVEIVKDQNYTDATIHYFEEKMKEFLGSQIQVSFSFVSRILRDASGKICYFTSKVNEKI